MRRPRLRFLAHFDTRMTALAIAWTTPSGGNHVDAVVADAHALAGAYLAGLAQLDPAVDRDDARRNQHLAGAATVADADQLQKLVQFDVLVIQGKLCLLHVREGS